LKEVFLPAGAFDTLTAFGHEQQAVNIDFLIAAATMAKFFGIVKGEPAV
jgi:hypothetical protein